MELLNANGSRNKIHIRMTKEELRDYVIQKYKKVDIHPVKENRKK